MSRKKWYLVQYDIACPVRLRKVHRLFKSCAFALQFSVYAWQGTSKELAVLQRQLAKLIKATQDDIRGYQLDRPLLFFGRTPFPQGCYFNQFPCHQHAPLEWLHNSPPGLFTNWQGAAGNWLVCYDMSHAKQRARACRLLRKHSSSQQKSGFELKVRERGEFLQILQQLGTLLDEESDSMLILRRSQPAPDWTLGNVPDISYGLLLCA